MDVVLVGLPGSGKSIVGRRLANRREATFHDLDAQIEAADGRTIPEIFAEDGEGTFRSLERAAVAALGPPDPSPEVRRVIATGGGTVLDPRNRWALHRRRSVVWLDGRPEVLAQRLRRSPRVRPLIQGRDPIGALRELAAKRERFYAAADLRISGVADVGAVLAMIESYLAEHEDQLGPTSLLRADTAIGRITLGVGTAATGIDDALRGLDARRAILVSEPGAWTAAGDTIAAALRSRGWPVEVIMMPQGEAAKRLTVIEESAGALARLRAERAEPIVAIGGGALGDAAGMLAAMYLRGVPIVHVPTTLVAQIDSSIGGKTAVDLPEGKNLVGAFHQPTAVVIDVDLLRTLPEAERRAALGEAVKMAVLGDDRLLELLEQDGRSVATGEPAAFERGVVAELVERCAWAKVEVVLADERERAPGPGRIILNLGHSLGHAVEAAAGYDGLRHGDAVAYGLRAAVRIGTELGVTPPDRAARIGQLLDDLDLATEPLPYPLDDVLDRLATDKKHADGRLRWVLPSADGVEVHDDVPAEIVTDAATALLATPEGSTR